MSTLLRSRVDTSTSMRPEFKRALDEVSHQEQLRLGKEIHDGLGQELMGVALLARGLAASARKGHQLTVLPKASRR